MACELAVSVQRIIKRMNEKENTQNPRGRLIRLVLGLISPILTGFIIINFLKIILDFIQSKKFTIDYDFIYISLIYIPVLICFQSIIYSLIMEYWINRKCKSNWMVVIISSFIGGITGYIAMCMVYQSIIVTSDLEFIIIGIFAGLITGSILRDHYQKSR